MNSGPDLDRRVIAEYVETWNGGHNYPGFCLVQVVEEVGKPIRVVRGRPRYIRDYPEMLDWQSIHMMATSNLRATALAKPRRRKA